jgi:hypothetical protein
MRTKLFRSNPGSRCTIVVFIVVALYLCFAAASAPAARNPVTATPRVGGGQTIERFVLMETIHIQHPNMRHREAMEFWMLPGQFIPVSEDGEGVYYQGTSGFRIFAGSAGQKAVPGGLYVSKTSKDRITPYVGNAKDMGETLSMDVAALLLDARMKLKVAHTERKG